MDSEEKGVEVEREEFVIIRDCLKEVKQIGDITGFIRHPNVPEKTVEGEPQSTQIINKLRELRRALRELKGTY